MARRALFLSSVIMLVVAVGAFYKAPASLLGPLLEQQLPGVQVAGFNGAVINGSAEQIRIPVNDDFVALGKVSWRLRLLSILSLRPAFDIKIEGSDHLLNGLVAINSQKEFSVSHAGGYFPVHALKPWIPLWVDGELRIQVNELNIHQRQIKKLSLMVAVLDTRWLLMDTPVLLGSYVAEAGLRDNDIVVEIFDHQAALGFEGRVQFEQDSSAYQLDAVLNPSDKLPLEISRFVEVLGKPDGDGAIVVTRQGKLN